MRLQPPALLLAVTLGSCDAIGRGSLVEVPQEAEVPHLTLQDGQKLIAMCGASNGYSYYPQSELVSKDATGFREDGISDGYFYLVEQDSGALDLIYKDAAGGPMSARKDGGTVRKLRESQSDAAYQVLYGGAATVEIYTFYREADGQLSFTTAASKGTDAIFPRSSLLAGRCRQVAFADSK